MEDGVLPFQPINNGQPASRLRFTIRRELEFIGVVVLAGMVSFFVLRIMPGYRVAGISSQPAPFTPLSMPSITPSLSPQISQAVATSASPVASGSPSSLSVVYPSTSTTAMQVSPDGTYQALLQSKDDGSGTKMSTFFTSRTDSSGSATLIYSRSPDAHTFLTIPYNTFSPGNRYVFLQETVDGVPHFLVFQTSGNRFVDGQQYLDVSSLFAAYTSSEVLYQVTGWASDTLLIIETDYGVGPSFWFDLAGQTFVPLSTRF